METLRLDRPILLNHYANDHYLTGVMKREHITRCLEPVSELLRWPHQQRDDGLSNAAVLIPLVEREQWQVLLTKRTDHLNNHAGQVSFPGGRADADDLSPLETALRETEEEVGIQRGLIETVGLLQAHKTVTGFNVIPVVGLVKPEFTLELDSFEVAEVFEVPLSILMDTSLYQQKEIEYKGERRLYWELLYQEFRIWGATAAMLHNLANRLKDSKAAV